MFLWLFLEEEKFSPFNTSKFLIKNSGLSSKYQYKDN